MGFFVKIVNSRIFFPSGMLGRIPNALLIAVSITLEPLENGDKN